MELQNRVVVVTGGARGIGAALCRRFAAEQAAAVVVTDIDLETAQLVADEIHSDQVNTLALECDVADETSLQEMVATTLSRFGRIDVFCSNAGVTSSGGYSLADTEWQRQWQIHVMSNVYAARAVLPGMLERGEGYLLQTASAAGLLTEIGSAPYAVTKHATVAFAEWLSVQHRRDGIRVSCLCPMGVETDMLKPDDPIHQFLALRSITADDVADQVIAAMNREDFLILPHPEVLDFFRWKGEDYERWLNGMSRLHQKFERRKAG